MKLFNYFDFIFESNIKVSLPLIFSDDFIDRVNNIDSTISKEIIKIHNNTSQHLSQYTLVSCGLKDDTIKYIDSYKLDKYLKQNHYTINRLDKISPSDDIWSIDKTEIKIGRFINKLFPNTFIDKEIQDFVNQWKSVMDESNNKTKFEIWSGADIKKAYKSNTYHFSENSCNPLMNSCMNDELDLVEFYVYCPTAKVLVLFDSDNLIIGRSLFWVDSEDRTIMDRVYYVYDKDYYKFIKYANDNNWYYKKRNISGGSPFIKNGKEVRLISKVRVPDVFKFSNEGFPYMDTFYYAQGEWAMNYEPEDGKFFKLIDTEGGFEEYNNIGYENED